MLAGAAISFLWAATGFLLANRFRKWPEFGERNNPRDGEFSVLSGYGLLLHDIFQVKDGVMPLMWRKRQGVKQMFFLPVTDYFWNIFI